MTRVVSWKRVCLNEQCGGWIFVLAEEGAEGGSSGQEGEAGRAAQAAQGKARANCQDRGNTGAAARRWPAEAATAYSFWLLICFFHSLVEE